jgi:hypothetical protein
MAHPVTPPPGQQAPRVEPGAPQRPVIKPVPVNPMFKSARILFPEPAAGDAQAVASKIESIAAKVKSIR